MAQASHRCSGAERIGARLGLRAKGVDLGMDQLGKVEFTSIQSEIVEVELSDDAEVVAQRCERERLLVGRANVAMTIALGDVGRASTVDARRCTGRTRIAHRAVGLASGYFNLQSRSTSRCGGSGASSG